MKITFRQLIIAVALLAITTACDWGNHQSVDNDEIHEGIDIEKNPWGAIQKVVKLGKNSELLQDSENREPIEPVSFKELLNYLPKPQRGWQAEEAKGETNSFGNHSISQVSQVYTSQNKRMKVSIFDWAFNSALYTPFLLTTEFSQESTSGYNKGIKIGDIPGREEYSYGSKKGSLNLLVNKRFLVQIEGKNIDESELQDWWKRFDQRSLNKLSAKYN